jgi:beta-lactamase superfamily II metal-dependent hydrolase
MSARVSKRKRNAAYLLLTAIILLVAVVTYIQFLGKRPQKVLNTTDGAELSVLFIDVGQADSALITLGTGETMLIDAGEAPDSAAIIEELNERSTKISTSLLLHTSMMIISVACAAL